MCCKGRSKACGGWDKGLRGEEVEEVDELEKPKGEPVQAYDDGVYCKWGGVCVVLAKDGVVLVRIMGVGGVRWVRWVRGIGFVAVGRVGTDKGVPGGRGYEDNVGQGSEYAPDQKRSWSWGALVPGLDD